jgi:prepilin-type processing-associated H-X9-DG protein
VGNEGYTLDPPRLNPAGDIGTAPYRNGMEARHSSKAAAVWGDGHGEVRSLVQYGYRILETGRYASFAHYQHDGGADDGPDPRNNLFTGTGGDGLPPELPR